MNERVVTKRFATASHASAISEVATTHLKDSTSQSTTAKDFSSQEHLKDFNSQELGHSVRIATDGQATPELFGHN
eukprot:7541801-Karenia_brevis.AAC.1